MGYRAGAGKAYSAKRVPKKDARYHGPVRRIARHARHKVSYDIKVHETWKSRLLLKAKVNKDGTQKSHFKEL